MVNALAVLNNGDLVSSSPDGTMKIWNVQYGTIKKEVGVDSEVHSFVVLPNGDLVITYEDYFQIWV